MTLEILKQNSESILESIDSYNDLLEQRAKSKNKKEIKEIDLQINDAKKHILELCSKLKQGLKSA